MAGRKKSRSKKKYYPKQVKKIAFWPSTVSLVLGSSIGFLFGRYSQVKARKPVPDLDEYTRYLQQTTIQLQRLQQQAIPSEAKAEELKNRIQELIVKSQELETVISAIRLPENMAQASLEQLQTVLAWNAPLYAGLNRIVPKLYNAARQINNSDTATKVAGMSYAIFNVLNIALTTTQTNQKLASRAIITNLASQPVQTYVNLLNKPLLGTQAAPKNQPLPYSNYWLFIYDAAKNGQDLSGSLLDDFITFLSIR